jgi:UDP-N-acetylglucosamine--N-acetylmuramyl-(pentapeptide) pyrophosphoryl-undecaprenol N-acetylglucosamine transferase
MEGSIKSLIVFTGGGTAGHVLPNIPIINLLMKEGIKISYVGGSASDCHHLNGLGVQCHVIITGKLRRYFSWQNFLDLFKVVIGLFQSILLLWKLKPQLVFSKGGFVSVPVCYAARLLGIPVFCHESDLSPGLATKLVVPFAEHIYCAFAPTKERLPENKTVVCGIPLRQEIGLGVRARGRSYCTIPETMEKPVLLVMGGSLGAKAINEAISRAWDALRQEWFVVHLTGEGKETPIQDASYRQFSFVREPLADLLAMADLVVGRAGATSIFELLSLAKPMLLIPLELGSRGDQILNANYFAKNGWAQVIREGDLAAENLCTALRELYDGRDSFVQAMSSAPDSRHCANLIAGDIFRRLQRSKS